MVDDNGITDGSIDGALSAETGKWEAIWLCTDSNKRKDTVEFLTNLRQEALREPHALLARTIGKSLHKL